jgi:Cof subfamily protein (haloacid dehalogenase superfamily)
MIKHIFCDLDGTLYHKGIDKADVDAIKEIEKLGVKFHIATGRTFTQAYNMVSNSLQIDGYYICENGAYIYDGDKNKIFEKMIDDNIVKKVISRFKSQNAHIYFKYGGKVVLTNGELNPHPNEYLVEPDFIHREGFDNLIGNIGIMSDDIDELNRIETNLIEEFDEVLDIYFSSETTLNLVAKGASKRAGIKYVCDLLKVSEDEVATMGDSPNDICMLKDIKYGFAMQNSRESVKVNANYIAKSVSDAIKQIIEINKSLS